MAMKVDYLGWEVTGEKSEKEILDEIYRMIKSLAGGRNYNIIPEEPNYASKSLYMKVKVLWYWIRGQIKVVKDKEREYKIVIKLICKESIMDNAKDYLRKELKKFFG